MPCKRGVPFPVCLLPQSSTYRCTSQDQAPYIPSLCEARFPSGPQVLSKARSSERAFSFSWGRNESDSLQRAPTIMVRKRRSQSRNGAVAENRAHRSARVAAPAATPNRLRGAKTRPQIVKKTLSRLYYPNYALLTCGFYKQWAFLLIKSSMLWRALAHGNSRDSCIYAISSLSCHVLFILSLFSTAFGFLNISYRRYLYISLVK